MAEPGWHELDVRLDLPPGEIASARAGARDLAVLRHAGAWLAFADECTHAECAFTEFGEVEDGVLICNCHGAEFDLASGEVLLDPAERPLQLLPTRVEAGALQVLLAVEPSS